MKRKLFDEIAEGFEALAKHRQGKQTLRTHKVESNSKTGSRVEHVLTRRRRS
jgi:hypothetical protein